MLLTGESMIKLDFLRLILSVVVIILPCEAIAETSNCNRVCGKFPPDRLPSPFGFSSGCEIQLNCTSNSTITINGFQVHDVTSDGILVNLPAQCGRPIETLRELFSPNFAPTSHNGILLQNCSSTFTACMLPTTMVQTHFELQDCGNDTISCYTEPNNQSMFLDYQNLSRSSCRALFSAIYLEYRGKGNSTAVSLDVQLVQVGWWLRGGCKCSKYANCTQLLSPLTGEPGYRCQCSEGYAGDGYEDGSGCHSGERSNLHKLRLIIGIVVSASGGVVLLITVFTLRRSSLIFHFKTDKYQHVETFLKSCGSLAPKRYRYCDVKKMTNSFKIKLGEGGYGSVYKGKLYDGSFIAAKILNDTKENIEEFMNEVASISRTSHVNVVKLLGFCFEHKKRALIYEFMPNGSLEKFIYNEQSLQERQLGWQTLYNIAIGIARGLEYLHRGCHTQIVHFDIKPHNILLDEKFCPKISDFGLSKLCSRRISTISILGARGTIGYIAPEIVCRSLGEVSHKSDVYSYGMMILEMVGGRRNVNVGVPHSSQIYYPHWVHKQLELNQELGLEGISNEEENEKARKMIIVSLWCIQIDLSTRPSITKVVEMLEGDLESLQIPPKP